MTVFDSGQGPFAQSVFDFFSLDAGGIVTPPVVLSKTDVVHREGVVAFSFFSVTDQSSKIFYEVEFYELNDAFIVSYSQDIHPYLFDSPSGYNSGEHAIFVVPEDSDVLNFDDVKFRIRGSAGVIIGDFNSFDTMGLTDLKPGTPELISCEDDAIHIFRWLAATDIPEDAEELTYTLEIYSATSSLSSLSAFSTLEGLSAMSVLQYYSMLSSLTYSGLLSALYTDSGISGMASYNYWQLLSSLSVGSYFARVSTYDTASHLVWSLFGAFNIGESKTLLLQPGFNLCRIPLMDIDALTARNFMEDKVGYYNDGGQMKPFVSEVVKWEEEVEQKKWKSIVASISGFQLSDDFDFEGKDGYFINLDYSEAIGIPFRGDDWI